MTMYILSIKPKYAKAILTGEKKVELRRLRGQKPPPSGAIMVMYASGDVQKIVGEFEVERVDVGTPEKIWALVAGPHTGVKPDVWKYVKGPWRVAAIWVKRPTEYYVKVSLEELRRIIPGWLPPRSYEELKDGDPVLELILKKIRKTLKR
ncbi:MAG: ASCH domain-containing protein [Acidilobaceae archaeon]